MTNISTMPVRYFLDLCDVPSFYTGQAGKVLAVNLAEDGVNFIPAPSPVMTLTQDHIFVGSALNIATDVAMSGEASIVASGAITLLNSAVIGKVITGYVSAPGVVAATDTILQAIQKLNGNIGVLVTGVSAVGATAPITSSGGTTPNISTSMSTNKLIGRATAGIGVMEEITIGSGLLLSGTTLSSTGSGGTVTSVSVVTNQGVSGSVANPTTTPAITLSLGVLTGISSINGLVITANTGEVTTGSWAASLIPLAFGGTNANLTASNGGIFYSTGSAGAILAGTVTAGQIVRSGSNSAPSWSTNIYPDTTAIGQVLYASSANVISSSSSLYFDGTNLGIGTNTPGRILNTLAARNLALIRIQSTETGTSTIGAGFEIGNSNAGSFLQMGLIRCSDGLVEIDNMVTGGSISLNTDGTPGVSAGTTRLKVIGSTGEVVIGGTAVTASEFFSIQKAQNGLTYSRLVNTTDGTSASSAVQIACGTTNPSNITTYVFSNSYTTSGQNVAGSVLIQANSQAIFNISQFANQPMAFRTNNTERIRINAGGDFIIENSFFYIKNTVSNTNYWKGTLISGVLTWTDTGSTAIP